MIRRIVHGTRTRLPSILSGAALLPLLAFLIQYAALSLIPATYWLSYEAIAPTEEPVTGDEIFLVSTRRAVAGTSVSWLDLLRCVSDDGRAFYRAEQRTGDTFIAGTDGEYLPGKPWPFPAPDLTGTCTLETNYTVHLEYGIEKTAQFESAPFNVRR